MGAVIQDVFCLDMTRIVLAVWSDEPALLLIITTRNLIPFYANTLDVHPSLMFVKPTLAKYHEFSAARAE